VLDRLDHTLTSDMTEAAAHRHAADQADSLAGVEESAASHEHAAASVSVFSGEQAEASEHEGVARVDDNLAAGAEATAAEERGMAAWAVSRAGVVFTPMRASELITSGRQTTRRPVPRSAPAWRMTNTENRNRSR
jgi:hypothetical protein